MRGAFSVIGDSPCSCQWPVFPNLRLCPATRVALKRAALIVMAEFPKVCSRYQKLRAVYLRAHLSHHFPSRNWSTSSLTPTIPGADKSGTATNFFLMADRFQVVAGKKCCNSVSSELAKRKAAAGDDKRTQATTPGQTPSKPKLPPVVVSNCDNWVQFLRHVREFVLSGGIDARSVQAQFGILSFATLLRAMQWRASWRL